jgi:hypothetical protein
MTCVREVGVLLRYCSALLAAETRWLTNTYVVGDDYERHRWQCTTSLVSQLKFCIGAQSSGLKYLWCNIVWGTTHRPQSTFWVHEFGEPKVGYFYKTFRLVTQQQNIFRLQEKTHFLHKNKPWAHTAEISNNIKVIISLLCCMLHCSSSEYVCNSVLFSIYNKLSIRMWKVWNLWIHFFTLYINLVITFFCSSVLQCHCRL